ncbi:MAG: TIGR02466 family protein [Pseudomonadota bacterium]
MAQAKFDIQPLFATPFMRADISAAITPDQVEHVRNLKMVRNRDNLISEDLYIFKHPELANLATAVQDALDIYARDVMGIDQRIIVTQSWGLMNPPGIGMHSHSHSNSIISGSVYYDELPEPVSRVFFDRRTMYQQIELIPVAERRNLYNSPTNSVTPRQGEVLMFPSDINHQIEANGSDAPRRAIAFNSFVKGTIGDYRDVSQLTV